LLLGNEYCSGTSSAAHGRAGEEYQVRARYQVRANALLTRESESPLWSYSGFDGERVTRQSGRALRIEHWVKG